MKSFCRIHLAATLAVTCLTAWFSYAYFHIDEYFQVIEWTRFKLGQVEAWALPWEHASKMRPWLQPFVYWLEARAVGLAGVRDPFALAFVFRLTTGLANVGALALFLRTALPWFGDDAERRLFVRVATLLGFLPYLFVRTSSEASATAALTAAFAILLAGATEQERARWRVPVADRSTTLLLAGVLFGVAFEARYQTAVIAVGIVVWLRVVGRVPFGALARIVGGGAAVIALAAPIDRWGYGAWCFPPWTYFQANFVEGAAGLFGADPPLAYLWMLPANVFAPVVVVLLLLAIVAWLRAPMHPLTWATLPFFVVHNLIPHKEERFVFPIAILATALVPLAIAPSAGRALGVSRWAWERRASWPVKVLVATSFAGMVLLTFRPIGWHHHVPFARHVHEAMGGEIRAHALPDFDLGLPAFHPRVYEIEKLEPHELSRRLDEGTAKDLLVVDDPILRTGVPSLDARGVLLYSELPFYDDATLRPKLVALVDAYNAHAKAPLRPLHFRSLYRLQR